MNVNEMTNANKLKDNELSELVNRHLNIYNTLFELQDELTIDNYEEWSEAFCAKAEPIFHIVFPKDNEFLDVRQYLHVFHYEQLFSFLQLHITLDQANGYRLHQKERLLFPRMFEDETYKEHWMQNCTLVPRILFSVLAQQLALPN